MTGDLLIANPPFEGRSGEIGGASENTAGMKSLAE